MKKLISTLFVLALMIATAAPSATARDFFDRGPASKFIELDLHVMLGGSALNQNYKSCFSEVKELGSAMGVSGGVGASGEIGLRDFLALGTQLNVIVANSRLDIAVSNDNQTSISNIFLNNRAYYINIPLYLSFRFNPASNLRWNVDGGVYYAYGFAGSQKQTIFNSMVNDLGELISQVSSTKPSFFGSDQTFVNKFLRGDIGVHIATGLLFARHYHIGLTADFGIKNISSTAGIKNPTIHNTLVLATLGYRF